MPIDPSIITQGIQPVQAANPMQTLAQISALRNQQLERAEAQQRIGLAADDLQLRQAAAARAQHDEALNQQAATTLAPGMLGLKTPEDVDTLIAGINDNPELQSTLLKQWTAFKKVSADIQNTQATAGKTTEETKQLVRAGLANWFTPVAVNGYHPDDFGARAEAAKTLGVVDPKIYDYYMGQWNAAGRTPEATKLLTDDIIQGSNVKPEKVTTNENLVYPGGVVAGKGPTPPPANGEAKNFWNTKTQKNELGYFVPKPGGGDYFSSDGVNMSAAGLAEKEHPNLNPLEQANLQGIIDARAEKLKPLDPEAVAQDMSHTRSGKGYLVATDYPLADRGKAKDAARALGVPLVDKEVDGRLRQIDDARSNQQLILDQVTPLLASGPGGRAVTAVTTPLNKVFQTNAQVASFNTYNEAAYSTLQALAGTKGVRMDQVKLNQVLNNQIKLTDSVAVAQQKFKDINDLFNNAENSLMDRDRRPGATAGASPAGAGSGTTKYYDINGNPISQP